MNDFYRLTSHSRKELQTGKKVCMTYDDSGRVYYEEYHVMLVPESYVYIIQSLDTRNGSTSSSYLHFTTITV